MSVVISTHHHDDLTGAAPTSPKRYPRRVRALPPPGNWSFLPAFIFPDDLILIAAATRW